MHLLKRLLSCLLLALVANLAHAATTPPTEPDVVWFHSDFPPITILNGPFKNQGAADRWEEFLIKSLPDLKHDQIAANTARLLEEMKHRDNACNPAFLKTPEREKNFIFSDPLVDFLPNGLITLRSHQADLAPYLNAQGELRLSELIDAQKFQIIVAAGRSFGQIIDPALQAGASSGKISQFNASDLFSSGLLQLSNHQNVDAVIGYAIELSWATRKLNLEAGQFWFIPIEGQTDLIPVHIACSRSRRGEQIITWINSLIRAGKAPALASEAYRDWLPDDAARYYDRSHKPQAKRNK